MCQCLNEFHFCKFHDNEHKKCTSNLTNCNFQNVQTFLNSQKENTMGLSLCDWYICYKQLVVYHVLISCLQNSHFLYSLNFNFSMVETTHV